jgi:hypothetical protein
VLSELRAKELSLERTTKTNEDYKSQNAGLTKKLDSKRLIPFATYLVFLPLYIYTHIYILLTLIRITEFDVELINTLKVLVKKALSFYPKDPSSDARTPQLLDGLQNLCQEVIHANMK